MLAANFSTESLSVLFTEIFIFLLIIFIGLITRKIFNKSNIPLLILYLILGIILHQTLSIGFDNATSSFYRNTALVIILIRAGLALDIKKLKQLGLPALLMCFVPAIFEIVGVTLAGPLLLDLTTSEAFMMGCILAAVSPAVIIPRMLDLIEKKIGVIKGVPQLIMTGSSMDDIVVILLFSISLELNTSGTLDISSIVSIPISVIIGAIFGIIFGFIYIKILNIYNKINFNVCLLLGLSGILMLLGNFINLSPLIAIIVMATFIYTKNQKVADLLSIEYKKLWIIAEIVLFTVVGTSLDISLVGSAGLNTIILLAIVLTFRLVGVFICLIKTNFNSNEKLFCAYAYLPKATVQAAIGATPLALGLPSGELILTVSILSILITAPIGAILIDKTYNHLLKEKVEY